MFEPPKIEPLEPRRLFSNFSPAQIETAYGFSGITFNNGAITANGAGQTIALIETDNDTSISSDLATFDTIFQIPAPPTLTIEGESGPTLPSNTAVGSSLYETALDVEWAHALAPAANILVVEANSGSDTDLDTAVLQATSNLAVTVVSTSYTRPEVPFDYYSAPGTYSTPDGHTGITFVAAAGDAAETMHPAAYSGVVGVGGTSLTLNSNDTYNSETVWSQTGGGPSTIFSEPAYQEGVQQSGWRETPDVAFDADPNTGLDVVAGGGGYVVGGTSAGAPPGQPSSPSPTRAARSTNSAPSTASPKPSPCSTPSPTRPSTTRPSTTSLPAPTAPIPPAPDTTRSPASVPHKPASSSNTSPATSPSPNPPPRRLSWVQAF